MKTLRTHTTRYSLLATRYCAAFVGAALAVCALCAQTAQETPLTNQGQGSIRGLVVSAMTTEVLEGAEITLLPSGRRTNAARDGTFNFGNVPAGDAKIVVSYTGLNTQEITLSIAPGKVSETTVTLRDEDVVQLEAFVVQGAKEGMSKAIAMQKAADDLRVIAAADQFGDIGGNLGEYMRFLPGVDLNDDGAQVSLRGMPSFLTNVTVDDTDLANSSRGEMTRITELNVYSLSNVETIEVIKTLTPDQPAINTGGSINMISKSAFDMSTPMMIKYRAFLHMPAPALEKLRGPGAGSGEEMTRIRPNLEINYSQRIGSNFGLYVGARSYQNMDAMQRYEWTYNFNPWVGGLPDDPSIYSWRYADTRSLTTRQSISARLDWKISPSTKWSASVSWNSLGFKSKSDDLEFFMNYNTEYAGLAYGELPKHTLAATGIYSSGLRTDGVREAGQVILTANERELKSSVYTYNMAFENARPGGGVLRADLYYSRADSTYYDTARGHFGQARAVIGNTLLRTHEPQTVIPNWLVISNNEPVDLSDITNYYVYRANILPNISFENRYGGSVSFTQKLPFALSTTLKAGAKWDRREREIDRRYHRADGVLVGPGDAMLAVKDEISSAAPSTLRFPETPAFLDLTKLWSVIPDAPLRPYADDYIANFMEDSAAAYARLDFRPAENWLIVAGVRHEKISGKNWNKHTNEYGRFNTKGEFYSLNLKYTPSRNHVFRAAATQSMGLPDYEDLLPGGGPNRITHPNETEGGRGRVPISNPNLKPYQVVNFDLAYEYHFKKSGVITLAAFRKSFKNYIIEGIQTLTDELAQEFNINPDLLEDDMFKYDLVQKFNIKDKGYYTGIEMSIGDRLTFLPAPFNTLGLQANLTLVNISPIKTNEASVNEVRIAGSPAENANLIDQVKWALKRGSTPIKGSIVLDWRYQKIYVQSSISHIGRKLATLTRETIRYTNWTEDRQEYMNALYYMKARTLVDLKIEYRWKQQWTPYLQARNIFNATRNRTVNDYFMYRLVNPAPVYEIGLRGTF